MMAYHTSERIVHSMRGYNRPLYKYQRVYRNKDEVNRRISYLKREYGEDNVVSMPMCDDSTTEIVYIRIN